MLFDIIVALSILECSIWLKNIEAKEWSTVNIIDTALRSTLVVRIWRL